MAKIDLKCPGCGGINVNKNGKNEKGVQRYICKDKDCLQTTFMLDYAYNGWKPGMEEQIVSMAANSSGIRDTARVLKVSPKKVIQTLKEQKAQSARST